MNEALKKILVLSMLFVGAAHAANNDNPYRNINKKCKLLSSTLKGLNVAKLSSVEFKSYSLLISYFKYKGYGYTIDKEEANYNLVLEDNFIKEPKWFGLSSDIKFQTTATLLDRDGNVVDIKTGEIFDELTQARADSVKDIAECDQRDETDEHGFSVNDTAKQCLNNIENDHADDCVVSVLEHAGYVKAFALNKAEAYGTRIVLAPSKVIIANNTDKSYGYYHIQPFLDHNGDSTYSVTTYAVTKGKNKGKYCNVEPIMVSNKKLNIDQMNEWLAKRKVDCE